MTHPSDEAGTGLPVAWQWRCRIKDILDRVAWDAWENGRAPRGDDRAPWLEYEERALYTHPPSLAFDAMREALKEIAEQDVTEIALDPDWPRRVALATLQLSEPHHD